MKPGRIEGKEGGTTVGEEISRGEEIVRDVGQRGKELRGKEDRCACAFLLIFHSM